MNETAVIAFLSSYSILATMACAGIAVKTCPSNSHFSIFVSTTIVCGVPSIAVAFLARMILGW